jgi:hypothetical protein
VRLRPEKKEEPSKGLWYKGLPKTNWATRPHRG